MCPQPMHPDQKLLKIQPQYRMLLPDHCVLFIANFQHLQTRVVNISLPSHIHLGPLPMLSLLWTCRENLCQNLRNLFIFPVPEPLPLQPDAAQITQVSAPIRTGCFQLARICNGLDGWLIRRWTGSGVHGRRWRSLRNLRQTSVTTDVYAALQAWKIFTDCNTAIYARHVRSKGPRQR